MNSSGVYVVGSFIGSTISFGSNPATVITGHGLSNYDPFVVKYDAGTGTAIWAQSGGGLGSDSGLAIALSGNSVYAVGSIAPPAVFGSFTLLNPNGGIINFLGELVDGPVVFPDLVISTSPQSVPAGTYNSITLTGTGAGTLQGAVVVNAFVDVQLGGVLSTNCQPLSGAATFALQAGGTLVICDPAGISLSGASGAVQTTGPRSFSTDASYTYNGTAGQDTGPGLPATVRALTVANPGGLGLIQNLAVRQRVRLTTTGNLVLSGQTLTLLSDAGGTALVANEGTGVVQGATATLQRYIDGSGNLGASGYRHYSSPVSGATVAGLATTATGGSFTPVVNPAYNSSPTPGTVTAFPTVFGYNEAFQATSPATTLSAFDKGWFSPAALAAPLGVGQGFAVQIATTEKVAFTGTFTTGTRVLAPLSRGSGPDAGWQFIGNPYPSPLDWGTVGAANTNGSGLSGMDAAAYVFQSTGPSTGQYQAFLNGIGAGLIAAGQGFFVRTTTPGVPGSVTLTNANRLTTFGATQPVFQRSVSARPLLHLRLDAGASTTVPARDESYVYFEQGATAGFDAAFDAHKLTAGSPYYLATAAAVPASAPNVPLSIDGRAPLAAGAAENVVALWLSAPAGTYTLTAAELLHFDHMAGGTTVWLRDALTGTLTNLATAPSYTFNVAANAPYAGRFALVFRPAAVLTTHKALDQALATVYPNPTAGEAAGTTLTVTALPTGVATVQATLLNALGQVVSRHALPVAHGIALAPVSTAGLAAGVYLLRLNTLDAQGQTTGTLSSLRLSVR